MTQKKEIYRQQIHKDCGGEIVAVASSNNLGLACKSCHTFWGFDLPFLGVKIPASRPEEWVDFASTGVLKP